MLNIYLSDVPLYVLEINETSVLLLTRFTVELTAYDAVEEKGCFEKNSELVYSKSTLVSRIHAVITLIENI